MNIHLTCINKKDYKIITTNIYLIIISLKYIFLKNLTKYYIMNTHTIVLGVVIVSIVIFNLYLFFLNN